MLRILDLPPLFRPSTSHVYPPFKNGKYMEEYFYDYILSKRHEIESEMVYVPIFWTNLQNHPGFSKMKEKYNHLLFEAFRVFPVNTRFFTVVQHDDGPQLHMPFYMTIYGACSGNVPLPLIYQDKSNRLAQCPKIKKDLLASFVGTYTTHKLRGAMYDVFSKKADCICHVKDVWSAHVPENDAALFIDLTLRSKFCLAPRGYGRSSFRFFEAILLDTIPVYFWDDEEWLPYKEVLDYSLFSVSISQNNMNCAYDILVGISDEKYENMVLELQRVKSYFTLDGMCHYVVGNI